MMQIIKKILNRTTLNIKLYINDYTIFYLHTNINQVFITLALNYINN